MWVLPMMDSLSYRWMKIRLQCVLFYRHFFLPEFGKGRIVRIGRRTVVKFGNLLCPFEAETLRFISTHTSVPLPKVYKSWLKNGVHFIVMQRMEGETLDKIWDVLSSEDKINIAKELKGYMDQIRALRQEDNEKVCGETTHSISNDEFCRYIGSINCGPCFDFRLSEQSLMGPFDSEAAFNDFLLKKVRLIAPEKAPRIAESLSMNHSVVFTHGDIAPRNILIKDGHITAILDWENAGWYPEYWEYIKALYTLYNDEWKEFLHRFLQPYKHEYEIDLKIQGISGWPY